MLLNPAQRSAFHRVCDAFMSFAQSEGADAATWPATDLIDRFLADNPAGLAASELEAVARWRHAARGPFFVMRHTPSCSIFMGAQGTFAVRGVDVEMSALVPQTPTLVDATLLPFDGLIVCAADPVFDAAEAGEASRADIDATYRSLSDKGVIYSAAALVRAVRDGGAARRPAARPARPAAPATSPSGEGADSASPSRPAAVTRASAPAPLRVAAASTRESSAVSEVRLAPVEMLRPRPPAAASASNVPAGLAQIIAFKPRVASAELAYS